MQPDNCHFLSTLFLALYPLRQPEIIQRFDDLNLPWGESDTRQAHISVDVRPGDRRRPEAIAAATTPDPPEG